MISTLQSLGILGLFLGSFLAATVMPFSSEVLFSAMLLVAPTWACFFAATLGNWLGGLTSFGIGWLGRWEWLERWFHVRPQTLQRQKARIHRWGPLLALFCWLPFVGDLFAIGLGFYRLPPLRCAFWMLLGKALRYLLWIAVFHIFHIQPLL